MIEKFATEEKTKYIPTDYAKYGRAGHLARVAFEDGIRGDNNGAFSMYGFIILEGWMLDCELCKYGILRYNDAPQLQTRIRARELIKMWTKEEEKVNERRKID